MRALLGFGVILVALLMPLRDIEGEAKRVPLKANQATAHMFIVKLFSGAAAFSLFRTHPPTDNGFWHYFSQTNLLYVL
jgi:hypothetical protein